MEGHFDNRAELIKFTLGSVFGDIYKLDQAKSRIKEPEEGTTELMYDIAMRFS